MKQIKTFLFLVFTFLFIFSFDSVFALSISPLRQTITLDQGKSKTVRLQIKNNEDKKIKLRPQVDSFKIDPKKGYPIFNQQDSAESWVRYDKNPLTLDPGEQKNIAFDITVPQKARSRAHYLSLFVKQESIHDRASAGSRVGSLLFLYVSGAVDESLILKNFSTKNKVNFGSPVNINLSLKNKGSIHVSPKGQLVVENQRGVQVYKKNVSNSMVLPGDIQERDYKIKDLSWQDIGKNEAILYLQYGIKNKPLADKISFWYIPQKLIYLAGSVIVLLLVFILGKKYRNNNSQTEENKR